MTTDPLAEACCGHALRWHEAAGCGFHGYVAERRCPCLLSAEEALAAHDAQVRADEREKVAARLADKGAVEKVARHVYDEAGFHAADSWNTEGSIMREHYRRDARAALDVIAGLIGGEQ